LIPRKNIQPAETIQITAGVPVRQLVFYSGFKSTARRFGMPVALSGGKKTRREEI
jgi:hypothetical protein